MMLMFIYSILVVQFGCLSLKVWQLTQPDSIMVIKYFLFLFCPTDVLMTLSGKTPHLYRHELITLHSQAGRSGNRFPLDRLLVPRRLSPSQRVPETRNCLRACVGKNPYNGYRYLCAATPNGIFLMQWYDPLNKFMLLKVIISNAFLSFYLITFSL